MKKKILFITPYVPYPLNSGGNQAFFHMVDYIRSRMSVSILLYPRHSAEMDNIKTLQAKWPDVTFHLYRPQPEKPVTNAPRVKHPLYLKWLLKAHASLGRKIRRQQQKIVQPEGTPSDWVRAKSTLPMSIFGGLEAGYVNYVAQVARSGFDIVQVEFFEMISLGYVLPENVETIFVHHEPRYVRNNNEMHLFHTVTDMDRLLYGVSRDYERAALCRYKHLITLTEVDRRLLADFIGRADHIHVSPAVVSLPEETARTFHPATTHRLTFVGSEDHYPNLDAVLWFCHEVVPLLRQKGFKFTFQVIGHWRSPYVQSLKKDCPELELTGYVEDLHGFQQGSIALVPIRIGAGMRMKIMDAISAGVPFATTPKGVEGLDFRDGEECLTALDPAAFADAVIRLSDDTGLQERLSVQAWKRLNELYDFPQLLRTRMAIYDSLPKAGAQ